MTTPALLYNPAAAERERPSTMIRVLPSLTDVAFILPIVFLFWKLGGAGHMLEGDTGWHIRAGEWILQNGRVPQTDIFSFTKAGEPWFAWEWLWDVAFAWLHQQWGMAAVVFVSLAVLCVTSAMLFRLVRRACPNVFIAFVATWVAMAAGSIHWLARPHLFTLLFAVMFLHILERARDGSSRVLFLLPAIMLVWVTCTAALSSAFCFSWHMPAAICWQRYSSPRGRCAGNRSYALAGSGLHSPSAAPRRS